jgi:hypothetical protein
MNKRRRWALVCSFLGFAVSTVCLVKTTPLTMLAFFNLALPLFLAGMGLYLYDIMTLMRRAPHR